LIDSFSPEEASMDMPIQITFRHMDASPALEQDIRERTAALEQHFGRISSCHVTVDTPTTHHRKGGIFRVGITVRIPRGELVSSPEHQVSEEHSDPYIAVRDGFLAVRRQLDNELRRTRTRTRHTAGALE
jgi:ribosomal subunit interface protein